MFAPPFLSNGVRSTIAVLRFLAATTNPARNAGHWEEVKRRGAGAQGTGLSATSLPSRANIRSSFPMITFKGLHCRPLHRGLAGHFASENWPMESGGITGPLVRGGGPRTGWWCIRKPMTRKILCRTCTTAGPETQFSTWAARKTPERGLRRRGSGGSASARSTGLGRPGRFRSPSAVAAHADYLLRNWLEGAV